MSRSRLRIARPEVTFFEMCSTCAVQVRDSSIIRPSDFVVSTLLISKLPTLIAGSAVTWLSLFLESIIIYSVMLLFRVNLLEDN